MTARDVMRSAAVDPGHIVGERQTGETLPRWQVRAILTALSEAGYSIVHESEIHGATRERCKAAAYSDPDYVGGGFPQRDDEGLLYPGSTYERGRYDARKAINSIAGGAANE